jgi:hypothetical protein
MLDIVSSDGGASAPGARGERKQRDKHSKEHPMSTPTIPTAQEVHDHLRGAVRRGEEAALEAFKSVADAVSSFAPRIPARVSDLTRPLAEALPNPEAVVAKAYDLAEKALSEHRRLTEEALKATAALRPAAKGADEAADEAAAPSPQEPSAE